MSQRAKTSDYSLLMPLDILHQLLNPVVHLLMRTVAVGAKVEKLAYFWPPAPLDSPSGNDRL
jgi:hypothetical protein